jgi:monovalent cation/hydrogen antiporter
MAVADTAERFAVSIDAFQTHRAATRPHRMATFETLLALVALCLLLTALADRLEVPVAVPLVVGGMALALIPGLPTIELDPELALALFLPPLLQISAYRTDWPAFKSNLRPILLLAIGAVFFTAAAIAVVAKALLPGLPWWAAVALGAIVSPPDAVAASSVLKRFDLPKRLVVVLEGESLINDAASLVLYRFAVAAVVAGSASLAQGTFAFVATAAGGAAIGWLVAKLAMWVFDKLDDSMLDIGVSIVAGFGAYLAAEALHASGVLAAVAYGLLLSRQQHSAFSARSRMELGAVWRFVEFLLSSLVFMLIGLQLRGLVERLSNDRVGDLALLAVAVAATLIVSRFVWVFATAWLPRLLSRRLRERDPLPPVAHTTVLSWAGMRGVVSLAAALALPGNFPSRDLIVFLAFCAIFATLVLQGTTLGWLVRRLGVFEPESATEERKTTDVRADIADAALDAVKARTGGEASGELSPAANKLLGEYEARAESATAATDDPETQVRRRDEQLRVRLAAIEAARGKLEEHTDRVDLDTHRTLGAELDLEEQRVRSVLGER